MNICWSFQMNFVYDSKQIYTGCPQNVRQDYGIGFRIQKGRKPGVMNMGAETLPCGVIAE